MEDPVHAVCPQCPVTLLADIQLVRELLEVHSLGIGGRDGLIEIRPDSTVIEGEFPWPGDIELDTRPSE